MPRDKWSQKPGAKASATSGGRLVIPKRASQRAHARSAVGVAELPLGAPVEAPPDAKLPCKPEDARGQWSYGPNCTPTPEG